MTIERGPDREGRSVVVYPPEWGPPPIGADARALRLWAGIKILEEKMKRERGESVGAWLAPERR